MELTKPQQDAAAAQLLQEHQILAAPDETRTSAEIAAHLLSKEVVAAAGLANILQQEEFGQ